MSNLSKTVSYLKRNGISNTYYAVKERLLTKDVPYTYAPISDNEAKRQKEKYPLLKAPIKYSILVPVYETNEKYLREMIESCLNQTYYNFELILADASETNRPKDIIFTYEDTRIRYVRLVENKGISENTNEALKYASGDYCALLDHDDVLTNDALYEMTEAILCKKSQGIKAKFIYSDEDKCNSDMSKFTEPHFKLDFDLDLLLSNNYICHFSVLETDLIKGLKFRPEYNGSQDYDLFLRAVGKLLFDEKSMILDGEKSIVHVPKILYHWRCHELSTSFNPESKQYAYIAGGKAIQSFVKEHFGDYKVRPTQHLGFYQVDFGKDIFKARKNVGAVGSVYVKMNTIKHGIYNEDGTEDYKGLNKHFSGYMHRLVLSQSVYALDIRTIIPSEDMRKTYEEMMELVPLASEDDIKAISLSFARELHKRGYIMLFVPLKKA